MTTIIQRHHLFAQLQKDTLPRLTVISAAPGYGKTVLAKQLASWVGYPTVWQQVDTWQRDVPMLYEQSLHVWSQLIAKLGKTIATSQPDIWNRVATLNTGISQYLDKPCLYIIDDVHHLADSSDAERWLQFQIDQLPETVHIVLVGRYLPNLSWTKLVGQGLVASFDTEHLRFDVVETQKLFQLPEAEAFELVTRFDGWIAGMRLAINQVAGIQYEQRQRPEQSTLLFHDMAETMFLQQAPDRQWFLLTTSVLPHISTRLCRDLFGIEQISPHLEDLLERNLFVLSAADGYRYHELFQQYLQEHLKKFNPVRFRELNLQLAQWYESQEESDKAVAYYVQAEAFIEAIRVAERVAREFQMMGRWESLLHFRELLSEHNTPKLKLSYAAILIDRNQLDEAESLLKQALLGLSEDKQKPHIVWSQLQLAFIYHRKGDYQAALEQAQIILENTQENDLMWALAQRQQGLAQLELGNVVQSLEAFEVALPIVSQIEGIHGRSHLLQDMSSVYLRSGNFEMAATLLQEVVALRRKLANPHDLALALNNLGYFYHCNSQYQMGVDTLEEGLELVQDKPQRTAAFLYWSLADIYRDLGQYQTAEAHYLSALRMTEQHAETLHSRILVSFARMRIWQGRVGDAQILLAESLHLLSRNDGLLVQVIEIMQSLLEALKNDTITEYGNVIIAIEQLRSRHAFIKLAQLLGFYLYVSYQRQQAEMLAHARKLISTFPKHLFQAMAAEIQNLPGLNEIAQEDGLLQDETCVHALNKLQQHHQLVPSQAKHSLAMMLDLKTLGVDIIHRDGQLVSASEWTIALAREFFYYLYFMGAQTKESLALVFWPEHDSKQIRTAFHDTLKRLRGAVPEAVVFDKGLYQINPDLNIRCDALAFRALIQRARHLSVYDVRTEDLYWRAIQLYQGILLPTVFSDWIHPLRSELQDLYIKALIGLGDCSSARQDFTDAVTYYQKAIAIDPYNETLYRLTMTAYAHVGQFGQVKQTFDELRYRLDEDLAIPPSPETQQLFKSLFS